ncbi:MAG: LapA family protein [Kiloniellaceae bacterium]
MHFVYWIVTFLFLIVFVTFTAANRHDVAIDFWPFEYHLSLPVALVLLGSLLTGFMVGAFLMWLRVGAARARARRAEQRATILERDVVELRRSAASQRSPGTPPPSPQSTSGLKAISGGH